MKQPSPRLLALYERCIVGSLVACEISVGELDLAADDFSDPKAQRMFCLVAEVTEVGPLEHPASFEAVSAAVESSQHPDALRGYLHDAYVDYVSRPTALSYADIVGREGRSRRSRRAVASRLRGRAA